MAPFGNNLDEGKQINNKKQLLRPIEAWNCNFPPFNEIMRQTDRPSINQPTGQPRDGHEDPKESNFQNGEKGFFFPLGGLPSSPSGWSLPSPLVELKQARLEKVEIFV